MKVVEELSDRHNVMVQSESRNGSEAYEELSSLDAVELAIEWIKEKYKVDDPAIRFGREIAARNADGKVCSPDDTVSYYAAVIPIA